jgi:alginate O-acetyltransferase complex protein AlgI
LPLIIGITFIAWHFGKTIENAQRPRKSPALILAIVGIVGCLVWFKYANLLVATADAALALFNRGPLPWHTVLLPIAISFTVLQAVSYLLDVHRGIVKAQPSFIDFSAYLDMFPHLIAGPILRYSSIDQALIGRETTLADFASGARRFMIGFSSKVLIADSLAPLVERAFSLPQPSLADAWLGNLAFALQIYFDFAGYSAMAIGLGKMLGFPYPENFRDPYLATSISDFWRRWHISLSTWLRDYLYIPLGGSRRGEMRTYLNLLATMAIGGLWHGASWAFLVWGLIHGVALAVARAWQRRGVALPTALSYAVTLAIVLFAWTPFRAGSWQEMVAMLAGQLGLHRIALGDEMALALQPIQLVWLAVGVGAVIWPAVRWRIALLPPRQPEWWAAVWPSLVFVYAIATMMNRQTLPFLYFQF